MSFIFFFFFQAEDGIRDVAVTGVQTCALPISMFGEAITQLAGEYPKLVAITAAMPSGTGTGIFQKKWPDRFFDVGIAEAHATTFAGGQIGRASCRERV